MAARSKRNRKRPRASVNVNAPCQCEGAQPHADLTGCRERYDRATYSTESTASVELASVAGGATATKPEALELWAGGEEGRGLEVSTARRHCSWARSVLDRRTWDWLSRRGTTERTWPLRERPLEGAPTIEGRVLASPRTNRSCRRQKSKK